MIQRISLWHTIFQPMFDRHVLDTLRRLLAGLILFVAAGIAPAATPALQLEVSLEPASSQFEAVAVVQPTRRDFRFVLHESLVIRSAEVAGKALKFVSLGRDDGFQMWRIQLPAGSDAVRISYGGPLKALQNGRDHRSVLRAMPPISSGYTDLLRAPLITVLRMPPPKEIGSSTSSSVHRLGTIPHRTKPTAMAMAEVNISWRSE